MRTSFFNILRPCGVCARSFTSCFVSVLFVFDFFSFFFFTCYLDFRVFSWPTFAGRAASTLSLTNLWSRWNRVVFRGILLSFDDTRASWKRTLRHAAAHFDEWLLPAERTSPNQIRGILFACAIRRKRERENVKTVVSLFAAAEHSFLLLYAQCFEKGQHVDWMSRSDNQMIKMCIHDETRGALVNMMKRTRLVFLSLWIMDGREWRALSMADRTQIERVDRCLVWFALGSHPLPRHSPTAIEGGGGGRPFYAPSPKQSSGDAAESFLFFHSLPTSMALFFSNNQPHLYYVYIWLLWGPVRPVLYTARLL